MDARVEDPLRLAGDFPQRERRFWSPGDQVGPCKREDNLKIEGEFTMRRGDQSQETKERKYFGKEENMKRNDNIKFSGEFSQRERSLWCPGDQVIPCNREDNLRLEGDFARTEKLRNPTGENGFSGRRDNLRQKDNIELDQEFLHQDKKAWSAGNRVRLSKTEENLWKEGEFCKREDILKWKDNMTKFAGNVSEKEYATTRKNMFGPNGKEDRLPGKQQDLRGKDNLRLEGEFSQREAQGWNPGERVKPCWRRDNLAMEGEFSKREDILLQDEILRKISTKGKYSSLNEGGRMEGGIAGVWDRGERVAKVVRPDNLSLR